MPFKTLPGNEKIEVLRYLLEVLHFVNMPLENKAIELIYGSNVSDINVELKAVRIKPSFYGYNNSSHAKLTSGERLLNIKVILQKRHMKKTTESLKPLHYR